MPKKYLRNHMCAVVLSAVVIIGVAACSSSPDTTTPLTTVTIDSTVSGEPNALTIDDNPLIVTTATVRLRGQVADTNVVRPGVRLRGTARRDAQGRLTLIEGDVSYPQALTGVLESVSSDSITLRQSQANAASPYPLRTPYWFMAKCSRQTRFLSGGK